MAVCRLLRLTRVPILQQLQLEEALLRADSSNWCIINDGTPAPAIVMGISGNLEELVHVDKARAAGMQVIRRFSGGGTVVVDENTVFSTLILQAANTPGGVECYPRPIMRWSEGFYRPVFGPHGDFRLQEHDYTFGERKFGGNAQAITKQRWLHHTSLLWDFDPANMALLKHPATIPEYRAGRSHLEFVCSLREFMPRADVTGGIFHALIQSGLQVQEARLQDAEAALQREHIKNTKVVDL